MYLYKNNKDKTINIYNFVPNKIELIQFKKKYIEDIKSVKLYINNKKTEELLFSSPTIMFSALDRKEENGEITHIEQTNNSKLILDYINGKDDSFKNINIIGHVPIQKSFYSGELYNQDSTLLFKGGSYKQEEFVSDESILLTGYLDLFQPLLSNNINNLKFPVFLNHINDEVVELLNLFSCTKVRTISLDDLKFLNNQGFINFSNDFSDIMEKSELVLDRYSKVKKKIKINLL